MLRLYDTLRHYRFGATDGEVGRLHDLYFEDSTWAVRYLVADTGHWLPLRLTLLSPMAFRSIDDRDKTIFVSLTREQIKHAPPITTDEPISRQFERRFFEYYAWSPYWVGPTPWGPIAYMPGEQPQPAQVLETEPEGDPHLRSARELGGYSLHADGDEVGQVEDFVIDDRGWLIRYMVAGTREHGWRKHVLLPPSWVQSIEWPDSRMTLSLHPQALREAPEFDLSRTITRAYEEKVHEHYRLKGYWIRDAAA